MSKCALCNKTEDERNIQEQAGYPLCVSCDSRYTDEELKQILDRA